MTGPDTSHGSLRPGCGIGAGYRFLRSLAHSVQTAVLVNDREDGTGVPLFFDLVKNFGFPVADDIQAFPATDWAYGRPARREYRAGDLVRPLPASEIVYRNC